MFEMASGTGIARSARRRLSLSAHGLKVSIAAIALYSLGERGPVAALGRAVRRERCWDAVLTVAHEHRARCARSGCDRGRQCSGA